MAKKPRPAQVEADALVANTPGLDVDAFNEWLLYRKAAGKTVKPGMYPWLISRMLKMGPRQAEAVEHSAGLGYQGLFLPKEHATIGKSIDPLEPW